MPLTHHIRLGTHAEKEYLQRAKLWFDSLVLNANLVEATRASLAVFATRLGKPYLIDPVSYAFALNPQLLLSTRTNPRKEPRVRATFASLASQYGLPTDRLGRRPLTPSELTGEVVRRVARSVLDYQQARLAGALQENAEFVLGGLDKRDVMPQRLVAGYFVEDFSDGWGEINASLIEESHALEGAAVVGVLAFDSRSANSTSIQQLTDRYSALPVREYFVWPTDLDEHFASEQSLSDYADLVSGLVHGGKSPVAAYGGFFALLLSFRGMAGLSHGVGYGDKRDLEPVAGGGIPPARFYVRAVRDAIPLGSLPILCTDLTDADYRERVCSCTICDGLLQRGGIENLLQELTSTEIRATANLGIIEVPTPRVYQLTRFHFLENRALEFQEIDRAGTFDAIAERLVREADWASGRLGMRATRHIARWIQAAKPD